MKISQIKEAVEVQEVKALNELLLKELKNYTGMDFNLFRDNLVKLDGGLELYMAPVIWPRTGMVCGYSLFGTKPVKQKKYWFFGPEIEARESFWIDSLQAFKKFIGD